MARWSEARRSQRNYASSPCSTRNLQWSWSSRAEHFESVAAVNGWKEPDKLLRLIGRAATTFKRFPGELRGLYNDSIPVAGSSCTSQSCWDARSIGVRTGQHSQKISRHWWTTHLCTLETEWIDVCFATILEHVEVITSAYSYSLGSTIHNYLHFTLLLCKNVNAVTMPMHNVSYNIISHHSRKTPFAVGYEAAHSFTSYALSL